MITVKDREKEFRKDLAALLAKHDADIHIDNKSRAFGNVYFIQVSLDGVYKDNDLVREYGEFEL
ncbi:MAG: hypothetical protein COB69_00240 [Phycisphaera sp.]|nr:MAG: hypothetical protein COB69_00240 [Phycisphaera sp.]